MHSAYVKIFFNSSELTSYRNRIFQTWKVSIKYVKYNVKFKNWGCRDTYNFWEKEVTVLFGKDSY